MQGFGKLVSQCILSVRSSYVLVRGVGKRVSWRFSALTTLHGDADSRAPKTTYAFLNAAFFLASHVCVPVDTVISGGLSKATKLEKFFAKINET